jgi:hypothetical protein
MQIQVRAFWQDIHGRRVQAGVYDETSLDAALMEYLVSNGHAVRISDSLSVKTERLPDFERMTKLDLVAYGKGLELDLDDSSLKADLVAALQEAIAKR